MSQLLDTTVIVDLIRRHAPTQQWFKGQRPGDLYLSAVTVGELHRGLHKRHAGSPSDLAIGVAKLRDYTLAPFHHRILAFDVEIAERWGQLMGEAAARRATLPADDMKIAATALHRGLTVVTSNTRHFAAIVPTIDPRTA